MGLSEFDDGKVTHETQDSHGKLREVRRGLRRYTMVSADMGLEAIRSIGFGNSLLCFNNGLPGYVGKVAALDRRLPEDSSSAAGVDP